MKKVLITGATGFVGSHTCQYLASLHKYEIFGTAYKSDNTISEWVDNDHIIPLNLLDQTAVSETAQKIKPNYVIHLAALSSPAASFKNPNEALTNNISAQVNLLEALKKTKEDLEKILIIGSAEEYGLVDPSLSPIDEMCPLNPTNPYAVSKITQDYLGLQYYLSDQLPITRLRPFNHTGERRPPVFVLPAFAKQVAEIEAGLKDPIIEVGNLEAIRDFTDVKDMVRAYELAFTLTKNGEVYNIGSGNGTKIQDLLNTVLKQSVRKIKTEVDPNRIKIAENPILIANNKKFSAATDWEPEIPLSDTVHRVLNYWREIIKNSQEITE